jgi:hypothetical protein
MLINSLSLACLNVLMEFDKFGFNDHCVVLRYRFKNGMQCYEAKGPWERGFFFWLFLITLLFCTEYTFLF